MSSKTRLGSLVDSTFSSLRHRTFRWYCLGVLASLTGSLMQEVVVAWVAYQMTGSSFVLGSILFSFQIPMILMGLVGGWAADRFDRKAIIRITQILALGVSLTWFTLSWLGMLEVWHLYSLSAVFGCIVAFEIPARFAIIPQLVSEEDTLNAFAMDSLLFYGGRVGGPAVATLILATVGATGCFAVNAITYAFELVTLRFVYPQDRPDQEKPSLFEVFKFAYGTPETRRTLLFVAVFSFCGVYIPMMPVFTDQVDGAASTNGLLIAASEVGAVIGSLLLSFLTASKARSAGLGRYVGIAGVCYAVFLALFAQSQTVWLSMSLILPVGFSMTMVLIGSHALLQDVVEDRMRGVISTVFWMYSYFGMFALGGPTFGWLVEQFGTTNTMRGAACVCIIAALLYMFSRRRSNQAA